MSTQSLNIIVSKKDLSLVVERASLAAMTEEGQSAIIRASNETRGCVRISAFNGSIVFDSSVSRFSSRYIVKVGEGSEAVIVSEGSTCVPAKELKMVASKIRDGRLVSIEFSPAPQDVTVADRAVASDGVVEIGSIKGSRVVSKTKIEAYPSAQFSAPEYPEESVLKVVLSGNASSVKNPCNAIGFSVNPQDLKELYDKFALFTSAEGIFFLGSDGRRCAVVFSKGDTFESFMTTETETPILVDAEFLTPAMTSLQDGEPLSVSVDAEEQKIYFSSGTTTYCINMISKELRKKYPNYKRIMNLEIGVAVVINRDELAETMDLLGIVSNDRAAHMFVTDEQVIKSTSHGLTSVKESSGVVSFRMIGDGNLKSPTIHLATKYLIEGIKKMKCENVKISFTKDELRVKIEDENDPAFLYFMQVMNPNE